MHGTWKKSRISELSSSAAAVVVVVVAVVVGLAVVTAAAAFSLLRTQLGAHRRC